MGKSCDQLPPSEALPDIGIHCVVFHNGKGFYYTCKDYQYSSSPSNTPRMFACVRPECKVTASMELGLGSPLIDKGNHTHSPDLAYREKCILLNTIRQRFLNDCSPAVSILQEVVSSISLTENEIAFAACDSEPTIVEEKPLVIKEEPVDSVVDPITEEEAHALFEPGNSTAVILEGEPVLFPESMSTYFVDTTDQNTCSSPEPSTSRVDPLKMDFAEENQELTDQVEHCLFTPTMENVSRREESQLAVRQYSRKRKQDMEGTQLESTSDKFNMELGTVEFTETSKGKRCLVHNGYQYRTSKENKKGIITWRCCTKKTCSGRLVIGPQNEILKLDNHSCTPDVTSIEIKKVVSKIKKRLREELTPLGEIYKEEFSKLKEQGLVLSTGVPKLNSFYRIMKRERAKTSQRLSEQENQSNHMDRGESSVAEELIDPVNLVKIDLDAP